MRVHAFAKELNVSLEKTVTGDFYPDKVEIVFVKPDVFSAGGYGVGFLRGIVNDLAGVEEDANVAFVFEDAEIADDCWAEEGSTRKESKSVVKSTASVARMRVDMKRASGGKLYNNLRRRIEGK